VRFTNCSFVALFACVLAAGDNRALSNERYIWRAVPDTPDQVALYKGDKQLGNYLFSRQVYYTYDAAKDVFGQKPTACPAAVPTQIANESTDALEEVNAARAARGLRPYILDDGLTTAALGAARFRAAHHLAGHTANDFHYLPDGAHASSAGCAAWHDSWGWGSCCTYDGYTYAGAAWVRGSDDRRYMHVFVR